MKKNRIVTVLLTASFTLAGCQDAKQVDEERLRPVRHLLISSDNAHRDRSFSGISKSSLESRLSFKVSGTISNVPVQNGQRLKAGDVIAEIDSKSFVLQAQQARASLVEAQANDRQAKANYERTKGLYANDNASLNDLDSARARAESGQAVVAAASKALEIAQLNLSYTRLTAAADCSIASLSIEVNENVSSGQQVVTVSCGDTFDVTIDLPESLIASVDTSTPVRVRFGAIPGREFIGQINEIAVASVSGSAAFPVVIGIQETHPLLRSGLAADVTFQFESSGQQGGGIVLPVSAVINDPAGTFVFVVEPIDDTQEAIVRRRAVSLGELTQLGVEVSSGLSVGDRVVTAGISVIRDGQRVLFK